MTDQATPAKVRLTDGLGPEERAKLDALIDHIYEYGTSAEGVMSLAAQLCLTAHKIERERCADAANRWGLARQPEYGGTALMNFASELRAGRA